MEANDEAVLTNVSEAFGHHRVAFSAEPLEKVRENRLRRMAERQGYALQKNRRRDPRANDFGGYRLVDPHSNVVVAGAHPLDYSFTLDEVEAWLVSE